MACLLYRRDEVSARALSFGFALACAGYDVRAPHLSTSELPELPGWSAAFYRSGSMGRAGGEPFTADDEMDHARELFEEELPPGLLVQRAPDLLAGELGEGEGPTKRAPVVYAFCRSEAPFCDDAWRFDAQGVVRRFLREGDEGLEAGRESAEGADLGVVESALPADASEAEEEAAMGALVATHAGSSFLAGDLGRPVLGPLMGALYRADERVAIELVEPSPASIDRETRRLVEVLRRVAGRGATERAPLASAPAAYHAFASAYDWADPSDPADLYRELCLGAVEGTLRFLRPAEIAARSVAVAGAARLFPLASLRTGPLGGGQGIGERLLALAEDGAELWVADGRKVARAGPTFAELLRYLALGWSAQSPLEELVLGALMLRARVRAEQP